MADAAGDLFLAFFVFTVHPKITPKPVYSLSHVLVQTVMLNWCVDWPCQNSSSVHGQKTALYCFRCSSGKSIKFFFPSLLFTLNHLTNYGSVSSLKIFVVALF